MLSKYEKNWDSKDVFWQQLQLNQQQLRGQWPPHWQSLKRFLEQIEYNTDDVFFDVGCGCGITSEVVKKCSHLEYIGIDASDAAINMALTHFSKNGNFLVKSWQELDISERFYFLIHQSALSDVMPDGIKCLEHLMTLGAKYLIFSRVTFGQKSQSNDYDHYGIKIYHYVHDEDEFADLLKKYKYELIDADIRNSRGFKEMDLLLQKKEQYDKPNYETGSKDIDDTTLSKSPNLKAIDKAIIPTNTYMDIR